MTKKEKTDYKSLTAKEKKIYDSIMKHFPLSSHLSALDIAWQGGVKFNFIPK